MDFSLWLLAVIAVMELLLFALLFIFFSRLRRSEDVLLRLRQSQDNLMQRMHQNAELEKELVASFAQRQKELKYLDMRLEERAADLRELLEQAEAVSRSPQFLRELISAGRQKGKSLPQLAKETNLSIDEVELILAESK